MFNFELRIIDSCVLALSIDNCFKRYLTTKEGKDRLNTIAKTGHPIITEDNIKYSVAVTENAQNLLEHLLVIGENKRKIDLPDDLAISWGCCLPVIHSYRPLSLFINYWDKSTNQIQKQDLFQQLSQDIFENPYVDNPTDYEYRNNAIAFHPNHGSLQAVRMSVLINIVISILKLSYSALLHTSSFHNTVMEITKEEQSCLELAAFLFKSGRTNEQGWSDDSTYGPRSVIIFTQIALDLGFNAELVSMIAGSFDFDQTGDSASLKQLLFQRVLAICHTCDLIRCNAKYEYLHNKIENLLNGFLNIPTGNITDVLLSFASLLCKETGSPVLPISLQVNEHYSTRGNRHTLIRSTNNLKDKYLELDHLVTIFYNKFSISSPKKILKSPSTFFARSEDEDNGTALKIDAALVPS